MKRLALAAVVAIATAGILASLATNAVATPSRTSSCANCHSGVNVPVSATLLSMNGSNATYSFSAPSADAVAVFNGSTKVGSAISATSGQFTVAAGATYTVFAVAGPNTNSGIGSTSVSPVVAPPTDTTAPTTTSNAKSVYEGWASIALSASDNAGGSGVATTYFRLDAGPQTAGTAVSVSTLGSHTLEFWSVDVAGNVEPHKQVAFTVTAPTTYIPIAGPDRFVTAIETSKRAFPVGLDAAGARTVVIATGRNWPDALGGTSLAGAVDGPVLLVDTHMLPAAVAAEITRLGAQDAIILGGNAAVGAEVENALLALLGNGHVERIAGTDRYKTADAVASRVIDLLGASYDGTAFVATGANFPDALAAAPLAAARSWPLFLAHPVNGLSAGTVTAMSGVDSILVLGGAAVVSPAVESYLDETYGSGAVTRLSGADRYATAVAVATYAVNNAGLSWDGVGIATGEASPDALAGGVLQGKAGSVMLLTRSASLATAARDALAAHKAAITTVSYYGGTGALSAGVRAAVASALL